jgi:hypothetical protein
MSWKVKTLMIRSCNSYVVTPCVYIMNDQSVLSTECQHLPLYKLDEFFTFQDVWMQGVVLIILYNFYIILVQYYAVLF